MVNYPFRFINSYQTNDYLFQINELRLKSRYIYKLMFEYIILLIILIGLFYLYKYYFKPRAEMKRYKDLLQKLGYRVYEQNFSFLGFSFIEDMQKGLESNKDVLHVQKTVYSQIDVSIGNIMDKVQIVLVNPDLAKQFFSPSSNNCYNKLQLIIQGTKRLLGNGIVFSEGEEWKTKRKLISKVFNFELVKENISKISQICNKSFDVYEERGKIQQNKFKYFIAKVGAKMFSGVMMKCFFGHDNLNQQVEGTKYDQFMVKTMSQASQLSEDPIIAFLGNFAWKTGLTSKIRALNRSLHLMRQKTLQILKKRTQQVQSLPTQQRSTDIIQALYYQKLQNKSDFSYNDTELIDEFNTFLIAGTDTTTRYFTMIVYYLGRNPRVVEKLRQQINSVIKTQQDITNQNLKKLTYTDWVQFETTRLFDVANGLFLRLAIEDNLIKDIPITKGTVVTSQPTGNHYSQKYFKDPFAFRPERWESECNQIHPFAFMGFGAGPRNCIGKQLAILSSKIALVNFILRYESFQVPEEITMVADIFYQPQPFDTVLIKRSQKQ